MSDRFIPVIFPHYIIEAQGDYVAPLGHAGFISVSGTGAATYYDFGRYGSGQSGVFTNHDSTTGNVRKTELGTAQFNADGSVTSQSLQTMFNQLTTASGSQNGLFREDDGTGAPIDTGMIFASDFAADTGSYDFINTMINTAQNSSTPMWQYEPDPRDSDPLLTCYSWTELMGHAAGVDIDGDRVPILDQLPGLSINLIGLR